MTIRNISEAKAELSRLVLMAEQGEEVIIARAGKPIVKLTFLSEAPKPRRLGFLKCEWPWTPELDQAFVEADADIEKLFEASIESSI